MTKVILIISVVLFSQACTTILPTLQRPEFPVAEYRALPKTGSGIVEAQIFMKTRGGDVKTAAGNEVTLNPVTSYSDFWYNNAYIGRKPLTLVDRRLDDYMISKTADADGRVVFDNVPTGEYYLTSTVTWESATGYQGAMQRQGGLIVKRITVRDGKKTEIILTR